MNLRLVLFVAATLALAGCKNPADDVPAASVNTAVEAATEEGSAEPTSQPAEEEVAEVPAATTITLNSENTTVEFIGSKVTANHPGGFRTVSGEVTLNGDDLTQAAVSVLIDTTSIYTDSDRLTGHLQSDDFFNVAEFPEAKFNSTSIVAAEGENMFTMTGDLDMHGVTQSVTFPATITVADGNVTANAEFSIIRQQWGIVYAGMPDDLIRDEVVLKLNINTAPAQ